MPPREALLAGDPAAVCHAVVLYTVRAWRHAVARAGDAAPLVELNPTAVLRDLGITPELNRAANFSPINTALATFAWLGMARGKAKRHYTKRKVVVYRLGELSEPTAVTSDQSRATQAHEPETPPGLPTTSERLGTEKVVAARRTPM